MNYGFIFTCRHVKKDRLFWVFADIINFYVEVYWGYYCVIYMWEHSFFRWERKRAKTQFTVLAPKPGILVKSRGPSIYYVSKGLGGWVQKMAVFADDQFCIYADFTPLVGGWVRKGPKMCWRTIWMVPSGAVCSPYI